LIVDSKFNVHTEPPLTPQHYLHARYERAQPLTGP